MTDTAPTLKCQVSSDLNELNHLHDHYPWIPNSEQIRPSPELIQQKAADMQQVGTKWACVKDYIYHKVFDKQYFERNDKYVVFDKDLSYMPKVFKKNEYPYQTQGNHWILWYSTPVQPRSNEGITKDINTELNKVLNINSRSKSLNLFASPDTPIDYDFVWYENPKMSVPDFYHVQVFWIPKEPQPVDR